MFYNTDGKIQELYNQLSKKSGEVYMQRTRQLYATSQCRTKLFTWKMEALDITALADNSFHGKENVLTHMMDIDPERYSLISISRLKEYSFKF